MAAHKSKVEDWVHKIERMATLDEPNSAENTRCLILTVVEVYREVQQLPDRINDVVKSEVAEHIRTCAAAQISAKSGPIKDLPPKIQWLVILAKNIGWPVVCLLYFIGLQAGWAAPLSQIWK